MFELSVKVFGGRVFLRFGNHEVDLELRVVKSSSVNAFTVCSDQVKRFSFK